MKALITGSKGQLGHCLLANAPAGWDIVAHDVDTLDIGDEAAVRAEILAVRPDLVLNAAAYTAVDRAESDEGTAHRINADAVGFLAAAAAEVGARLAHVSTDFVFDGESGIPYRPNDPTAPLSVYGRTKLAGEQAAGPDALVLRTSWVYGPVGNNFVRTMLRLMGERPEVRVVADQIGTPTYAPGLALALWQLATVGTKGVFHFSDSGAASWYDFAVAIEEEASAMGLLEKRTSVVPIATANFPTPAKRPHFSILDKSDTWAALGAPGPHWRSNLRLMLNEIQTNG